MQTIDWRTRRSNTKPEAERFWEKVNKQAAGGCWEWQASRMPNGYGRFVRDEGGSTLTHRIAYEMLVGPIPAGLQIDHLCRNRGCVNPAHLEPVTARQNVLRSESMAAHHAKKTHCPAGHPYAGDNLHIDRSGSRICRACHRQHEQNRRDRLKGAA